VTKEVRKLKNQVKKATSCVQKRQKWAHAALQGEFGRSKVSFDELVFRQFVAGELEIITGGKICSREKSGRLQLLKNGLLLGNNDWGIVHNVYGSVVHRVEL